jgi:hypothetical protein
MEAVDVSLSIGGGQSGLKSLVQWLILAAVIGAVLNSKDIQRYLKIREM